MTDFPIDANDGSIQITATGGETELDFDFPIYAKAHLKIIRTRSGTNTTLVLDTDYTIADGELEQQAGGTAVLLTGATAGDVYTLLLNPTVERQSDYQQSGDLLAATVNQDLDLIIQMLQAINRDKQKALALNDTEEYNSSYWGSIPALATRASKFLAFDSNGKPTVSDITISGLTVSAFASTLLDDLTAAAAATTLGLGTTDTVQFLKAIIGNPGTEDTGINIGGTTYESSFKVSDIDGTNSAQTILHRHSTTLEPLIIGARTNDNTSSHTAVTNGQNVFSVYGAGYAGSNYKLFGSMSFGADSTGTISNTSAPGKFVINVTPDGSVTPAAAVTINNDKSVTFAGNVTTGNLGGENLLINGQFRIAQRGTAFTSASTPANNDDTYLLDRWNLVSDGNDIADVSQETTTVPTGSYSAIKMDQETANKQWGLVQVLEAKDAAALINGTASLSFKARKGASNTTVETLRAAIISWGSTADAVTSDVVGTWAGAGTNPTLAANWTYENTPSSLILTTSYQTFKIENVSIDTASTANVAVFIWLDDTDGTVGDLVYISDVKLEKGSLVTPFISKTYDEELLKCRRFYTRLKADGAAYTGFGSGEIEDADTAFLYIPYPTQMISAPSLTLSNVTVWSAASGYPITATENLYAGLNCLSVSVTMGAGGATAGRGAILIANNNSAAYIELNSEL